MKTANAGHPARGPAGLLIKSLSGTLGLAVPVEEEDYAKLERSLAAHLARVGPSNVDDLSSWVLLECLEKHRGGTEIDWAEVLRAADRIRHRITRQHARERTLSTGDLAVNATVTSPSPGIDVKSLLKKLPQEDLVIFHGFFLDGKKAADIAQQLGLSLAQVYRRLSDVREMLTRHLR